MRTWWKTAILYAGLGPVWLSVPVVLILRLVWGGSLSWAYESVVLRAPRDSWFSKRLAGLCLGPAMVLDEEADEKTVQHELTHRRQIEAWAFAGFVLGLLLAPFSWPLLPLVWLCVPVLGYFAGSLVAVLRGGRIYEDNPAEQAARDHVN